MMFKQITGAYYELNTLAHVEDIQNETYAIVHGCSLPVEVLEEGVQLLVNEIWDTLELRGKIPFLHYPPEQILAMQHTVPELNRWQPLATWFEDEIHLLHEPRDYCNPNVAYWRDEYRVNAIELKACVDVAAELFVLALPLISHYHISKVELTVDTRDVFIELKPRLGLGYVESLGNL